MKKEVQNWWKQSQSDLEKAKVLFKSKNYDGTAFFCQQTIEKAFKALHIKKFNELRKVHDLVFLGQKIGVPNPLLEFCSELNKAYIETRYPDAHGVIPAEKFSKEDMGHLINITEEILQWLEKQL